MAITLTNLGIVLQDLGDLAAAWEHQQQALRILEAAYGPAHPHTQTAQQSLDALPA